MTTTAAALADFHEARMARRMPPEEAPLSEENTDTGPEETTPEADAGDLSSLHSRIKQLERERDAAIGRVAPMQKQSDIATRLWQESESQRKSEREALQAEMALLRNQERETERELDLSSVLSEEELNDIDPSVLSAAQKIARATLTAFNKPVDTRAEIMQALREQDMKKVEAHRKAVLTDPSKGLHKLSGMLEDPKFLAWYGQDETILDSVMSSLVGASTTESIDRYAKAAAKELQKYNAQASNAPDPRTEVRSHMRRKDHQQLTQADFDSLTRDAKRLMRSPRAEDRKEAERIIQELDSLI